MTTDDIVAQARACPPYASTSAPGDLCHKLADEIERLRTALTERDAQIERLTRELAEASADVETMLAEANALTARATTAERERDAQKRRGDNHAATLRGVRTWLRAGDTERALLWISDGLSGYSETAEKTLADEIEKRETAERDLAEARAEVERKDAALKRIESWEPATQEMTLAHQMAAEARAALKPEEVAKGEISGNTIRNTPGAGFLFEPDRAGLIAGLRECAELAGKHAADGANLDERSALLILAQDIRARITALEEDKS